MSAVHLSSQVQQLADELVRRRRDLHAHPELGFQERRTAGLVAEELRRHQISVRAGVGRTGVVGLISGAQPSRTVLLRADMDCLPVQEQNQVDYVSQNPGLMHACGHDGHTAMLLGAAQVLARRQASLAGQVKLVFQPAEEGAGGASAMIQDGVLKDPPVDAAFGVHLFNSLPVGQIGVTPGPVMSAGDILRITIIGRGTHGASPHLGVDPVVASAQLVLALQTIVSRQVNPLDTVVLSIGAIKGGEAYNVIPDQVTLVGTVRTFQPEVRSDIHRRIEKVAQGVAEASGTTITVSLDEGFPPTINDQALAELVAQAAAEVVGQDNVVRDVRWTASEDMSLFLEAVPGCYFFIGSANAARGLVYPHHSPRFDFDEQALSIGVEVLAKVVERYLAP